MADRSTRAGQLPGRALLPLLIGLAFAPSSRAEVKVTPSVSVQETWTDNVNLLPADQAHNEFITDVAPGVSVTENNPRMQLAASYQYHEFAYTDRSAPNLHDNSRQMQAALKAKPIEDLLYLDADANRNQQAISAFGPGVADNPYTTNNRTEVSTWRVSPYLAHRIGTFANLLMRYTRDSVQTSVLGYGNTHGQDGNVSLSSATEQRLGWNLSYDHQQLTDRLAGDSSSSNAAAGLSWRVRPSLALTGSAGYDKFDYPAMGQRTRGRSWSVGYQYTPSNRTTLSMSVGRRYFGSSKSLLAMHRSRHTVWNVSYDESVTTSREQFLLPATVDTATLLDRLFSSSIPDPDLRRQAVDAYLKATGLPTSLANNVNYLSNRYLLQKQMLASVAMEGAHSTLLLSVFNTHRNALSVQQADSELLGNNLTNLNDNVHQRGVAANFDYRMSSRTDALVMADATRSLSLDTGIRTNTRALRFDLRHQFLRQMQGVLELRRMNGSSGLHDSYTENAISATLSMKY